MSKVMSEQKPEQKPIDFIIEQLKLMRGSVIAASARVTGLSPADPPLRAMGAHLRRAPRKCDPRQGQE